MYRADTKHTICCLLKITVKLKMARFQLLVFFRHTATDRPRHSLTIVINSKILRHRCVTCDEKKETDGIFR